MTQFSLERGAQVIRDFAATLPESPGVYRMLSEKGEPLYVGKAKALKRRVFSYTQVMKLPNRLKRMVSETTSMEVIRTGTEVEALLLESNLIKKYKPRFNVLLRDDKSFPYIWLTSDHDYPQVKKYRGSAKEKGEFFGPFANGLAVNRTIDILQRLFKLRNCSDNVFANRSRPCLQYHIKRCTAPCVNKISKEDYAIDVAKARAFLHGESRAVQDSFSKEMHRASEAMDYELAAELRDKIQLLTTIQSHQDINISGMKDVDVIGLVQHQGQTCIQVFFYRGGQNFGNRPYFPRHQEDEPLEVILAVFMAQFYQNKPVPPEILTSIVPDDKSLLEEALSTKAAMNSSPETASLPPRQRGGKGGRKVTISAPLRGQRKRLIDFVMKNAKESLDRQLLERKGEAALLEKVAKLFDLDEPPNRIEVYDNSHISGTNMVGAMVVAGPEGFVKNAYRKFNIKTADASDDYGMMREVMTRRFGRTLKEGGGPEGEGWPDLLLIDGGKGQLSSVKEALEELGVWNDLTVVAIAKGPDRHAGREQFFIDGRAPFQLPINDAALHYLQRLRDEVHRFAIGAHRTRRKMDISKNPLDEIGGIGAKRKRALLLHFGSAKGVGQASIKDLMSVEGISQSMAEKIHGHFNG